MLDGKGGLGAFLDPEFDAGLVDHDLLGEVRVDRVVIAKLFDDLAIARGAMIDGVDAPEGMVLTAEALKTEFNHVRDLNLGDACKPPGRRPSDGESGTLSELRW